jgi:hypothetical protein
MGDTLSSQKEFIDAASVVINTLAYTPELREKFQETIKKQYGMVGEGGQSSQQPPQEPAKAPAAPSPEGKVEELGKQVTDMATSQREQIIAQFEKEYGIDQLKDEEKAEARKKIEGYLNDFGWSVRTAPLPSLRANLNKAYIGTHAEKLKEEGKLEGFTQARTNAMGTMPSISGTTPPPAEEGALTPKQAEWAEKFGRDVDKVKKVYTERDKEEKRKSLQEIKAEEAKRGEQ